MAMEPKKLKSLKIPKNANFFYRAFLRLDEAVKILNTNTLFVGLMMFVMQIASRFVTIKLSRSMEGYMKFSFSKDILVFAIAFMGTRDLYWALVITLVFIICMDYLFNEESSLCCLPESFLEKHIKLLEESMDASGNRMGGGGVVGNGIGVSDKNSSISGAPGLGYSVGVKDSQGQTMSQMDTSSEQPPPNYPDAPLLTAPTYSGGGVVNKNDNEVVFSSAYSSYR
jgi:hypothetical protein